MYFCGTMVKTYLEVNIYRLRRLDAWRGTWSIYIMWEYKMSVKPYLLVVTGKPGSGKTIFANKLGNEIFMPVIHRDGIKEGYVHTFGKKHTELPQESNKITTEIFFDTLMGLIDNNISVIAEAAFQHGVWSYMLKSFMEKARIYLLICKVADEVAHHRFIERGLNNLLREYFHGDKGVDLSISSYEEPHLNVPTIYIDTTGKYSPSIKELSKIIFGCCYTS